jgi:proteic killer suppression protein
MDLLALPLIRRGELVALLQDQIDPRFRVCFRWTEAGPEDVEIVDYH